MRQIATKTPKGKSNLARKRRTQSLQRTLAIECLEDRVVMTCGADASASLPIGAHPTLEAYIYVNQLGDATIDESISSAGEKDTFTTFFDAPGTAVVETLLSVDTVLGFWDDNASVNRAACDDDSGATNSNAMLTLNNIFSGEPYTFMVAEYLNDATGPYTFVVNGPAASSVSLTFQGDSAIGQGNVGTAYDYDFFAFNAPISGRYVVNVRPIAGLDVTFQVYDGAGNPEPTDDGNNTDFTTAVYTFAHDESGIGVAEKAVYSFTAGNTYYVRVDGYEGSIGDFTVAVVSPAIDDDIVGRASQTGQWWVAQSNGSAFVNRYLGAWSPSISWADVQTADINADGQDDIVGRWPQTGQWWVGVSNGSSVTNQLFGTWSSAVTWSDVRMGDVTGDGRADLVGRWLQAGQWYVGVSNGSAFTTASWGNWSPSVTWVNGQLGDVTGDGRADIIGRVAQTGQWWVGVSSGSAFTNQFWGAWAPSATWVDVQLGDINGDGRADVVGRWLETGNWYAGISNGSSFTNQYLGNWSPSITWVDVRLADVNGDGRDDVVGRASQSGQWWAALSNGTSISGQHWSNWSTAVSWVNVQVTDVTADGRADIVGRVASTGQWWVGRSTGTAFANQFWGTFSPSLTWVNVQAANMNDKVLATSALGSGGSTPTGNAAEENGEPSNSFPAATVTDMATLFTGQPVASEQSVGAEETTATVSPDALTPVAIDLAFSSERMRRMGASAAEEILSLLDLGG